MDANEDFSCFMSVSQEHYSCKANERDAYEDFSCFMSVSQEHYSCRLMRGMLMKTFRVLCQCLRNTTPVG